MYQLYQRVAPRPEDFGRLLEKIGEYMSVDFDFSEQVSHLTVPTLVVAADADMAAIGGDRVFQPERRARLLQSQDLRSADLVDPLPQQPRRHIYRCVRAHGPASGGRQRPRRRHR